MIKKNILKLNPYTAELIGLHIGDGTLYNTKYSIVWELRGSLNEKSFYNNHIKDLIKSIFTAVIKAEGRLT